MEEFVTRLEILEKKIDLLLARKTPRCDNCAKPAGDDLYNIINEIKNNIVNTGFPDNNEEQIKKINEMLNRKSDPKLSEQMGNMFSRYHQADSGSSLRNQMAELLTKAGAPEKNVKEMMEKTDPDAINHDVRERLKELGISEKSIPKDFEPTLVRDFGVFRPMNIS